MEALYESRKPIPSEREGLRIERWTIDRIDRDEGVVRIEVLPLCREGGAEVRALARAIRKGGDVDLVDQLYLWDLEKRKTKLLTLGGMKAQLRLSPEHLEILAENMVFWVLGGRDGRWLRVLQATPQARTLAKRLYKEALAGRRPRS